MRKPWLLITLLIIGSSALVSTTYSHFNATWDEPEHVAAGVQLLDRGEYIYDVQHPPLARIAMALGPWLAGAQGFSQQQYRGPSGEPLGRQLFYGSGHYDFYLYLARLGVLPFWALMLWCTWAWTRHFYGERTGLLAALLLASTPPLLGHAGLAALDVPGAAMCTLALYCLARWFAAPTWRWTMLAGGGAGLAMATKLSALPFIGLVALAWMMCAWAMPDRRRVHSAQGSLLRGSGQLACMALLALLCLIFSYGFSFHYSVSAQTPSNAAWNFAVGSSGPAHDLVYALARAVPLPRGLEELLLSIRAVLLHNQQGHTSFLLGQFSETGFRTFYLVALAVKTPPPLLLLGGGGLLVLGLQARQHGWLHAAPALAFIVLLAFCSFYSHINIGLRHVFVLYPLLCIGGAVWAMQLWQRHAKHWQRAGLALLIGWQLSLLWSAYPDYLAYFNFSAGRHPEHVLIDSDLDWGQDLQRLQQRLTTLQVKKFGFIYRGTADVIGERLPGVWMVQPFTPTTGWIAASIYARDVESQGRAYAWLKQYTPRERIGKSIDLYYIPPR